MSEQDKEDLDYCNAFFSRSGGAPLSAEQVPAVVAAWHAAPADLPPPNPAP